MKRSSGTKRASLGASLFLPLFAVGMLPVSGQAAETAAAPGDQPALSHTPDAPEKSSESPEEEEARLIKQIRAQIDAGDTKGLSETLTYSRYPYPGNPLPLIETAWQRCQEKKVSPPIGLALKFGLHREEAIAAFRAMVRDRSIQDEEKEAGIFNGRVYAASELCLAGAKEAADDIWDLCKERKDLNLAFLLASELGDERPRQMATLPLEPKSKHALENYALCRLLGHFKVQEAVEPLKKQLAELQAEKSPWLYVNDLNEALFQITGDETYLSFLFDHAEEPGVIHFLARTRRADAQKCLQRIMIDGRKASSYNHCAFIGLFVNYPGDPAVRQVVADSLDQRKLPNWLTSDSMLRVAAGLHDAEIDRKAMDYHRATGDPYWAWAFNRRDLPLWTNSFDY